MKEKKYVFKIETKEGDRGGWGGGEICVVPKQ